PKKSTLDRRISSMKTPHAAKKLAFAFASLLLGASAAASPPPTSSAPAPDRTALIEQVKATETAFAIDDGGSRSCGVQVVPLGGGDLLLRSGGVARQGEGGRLVEAFLRGESGTVLLAAGGSGSAGFRDARAQLGTGVRSRRAPDRNLQLDLAPGGSGHLADHLRQGLPGLRPRSPDRAAFSGLETAATERVAAFKLLQAI